MSNTETGVDHCLVCGKEEDRDSILDMWMKPFCDDCWPSECPNCGETKNYTWSRVDEEMICDQGCHFNNDLLSMAGVEINV